MAHVNTRQRLPLDRAWSLVRRDYGCCALQNLLKWESSPHGGSRRDQNECDALANRASCEAHPVAHVNTRRLCARQPLRPIPWPLTPTPPGASPALSGRAMQLPWHRGRNCQRSRHARAHRRAAQLPLRRLPRALTAPRPQCDCCHAAAQPRPCDCTAMQPTATAAPAHDCTAMQPTAMAAPRPQCDCHGSSRAPTGSTEAAMRLPCSDCQQHRHMAAPGPQCDCTAMQPTAMAAPRPQCDCHAAMPWQRQYGSTEAAMRLHRHAADCRSRPQCNCCSR